MRSFELQLLILEEVLACLHGWFSAAFLCFPLLVDLRSSWKWMVDSGSIRFVCCFAFVTVPLFGDIIILLDTLVQFSLRSGRDENALAVVRN